MTEASGVNSPRAVMLTIGAIAERDGVSKPAVSRKVKQLVAGHGLTVERDGQGRVALVNVAEYDHLRGRFDDPSKAQAPKPPAAPGAATSPPPAGASESYDEALRQKTWTEAERSRLRLEEERRQLVRVTEVAEAAARCSEDVVRVIRRLHIARDDIAAAVAREGAAGLGKLLKTIVDQQCSEIADAFARLAMLATARAPAEEPDESEQSESAS